jgi:hypothetical protein
MQLWSELRDPYDVTLEVVPHKLIPTAAMASESAPRKNYDVTHMRSLVVHLDVRKGWTILLSVSDWQIGMPNI